MGGGEFGATHPHKEEKKFYPAATGKQILIKTSKNNCSLLVR